MTPMLPRLIPITDLKRQGGKVLEALRADRSPMVITEHGRAAAVLMDIASYEAMTRRYEILKGIDAGEQDIAAGRTITWEEAKVELRKWQR
jgi:prevent-host-death family protein